MHQVTTRVSDREYEHLARFCKATERTQSDVTVNWSESCQSPGYWTPSIDRLSIPTPTWLQVWCGASGKKAKLSHPLYFAETVVVQYIRTLVRLQFFGNVSTQLQRIDVPIRRLVIGGVAFTQVWLIIFRQKCQDLIDKLLMIHNRFRDITISTTLLKEVFAIAFHSMSRD